MCLYFCHTDSVDKHNLKTLVSAKLTNRDGHCDTTIGYNLMWATRWLHIVGRSVYNFLYTDLGTIVKSNGWQFLVGNCSTQKCFQQNMKRLGITRQTASIHYVAIGRER